MTRRAAACLRFWKRVQPDQSDEAQRRPPLTIGPTTSICCAATGACCTRRLHHRGVHASCASRRQVGANLADGMPYHAPRVRRAGCRPARSPIDDTAIDAAADERAFEPTTGAAKGANNFLPIMLDELGAALARTGRLAQRSPWRSSRQASPAMPPPAPEPTRRRAWRKGSRPLDRASSRPRSTDLIGARALSDRC